MTIYFPKPTGAFTTLPNAILTDTTISLQARALLTIVLAGAYRDAATTLTALGETAGISTSQARRLVDELTAAGYARREGHRLDFTSTPGNFTTAAVTPHKAAAKPTTPTPTVADTQVVSRIVAAWKQAAAGRTAQKPTEIRRLATQALDNGATEQAVTEAITTIAAAGEPVKDFRITLALSGRYRPAADKSIHYAADRKTDASEYSEDLTPAVIVSRGGYYEEL